MCIHTHIIARYSVRFQHHRVRGAYVVIGREVSGAEVRTFAGVEHHSKGAASGRLHMFVINCSWNFEERVEAESVKIYKFLSISHALSHRSDRPREHAEWRYHFFQIIIIIISYPSGVDRTASIQMRCFAWATVNWCTSFRFRRSPQTMHVRRPYYRRN